MKLLCPEFIGSTIRPFRNDISPQCFYYAQYMHNAIKLLIDVRVKIFTPLSITSQLTKKRLQNFVQLLQL